MGKCKVCGKPIANGLDFCSKECMEKSLEVPIADVKEDVKEDLEAVLLDPHHMRGLAWRKDKLEAIHKALQLGYNEEAVLRILMKGGLTRLTAKRLVNDSKQVYGYEA